MAKSNSENLKLFHRSMEFMKTDNVESLRALVDQLEPVDIEKGLQMYKKAYRYLKARNPNMPPLK